MERLIDTFLYYADQIWLWVSSWSETFSGVVIGAAFTLAGVVLTNRTNLENLRLQLSHDREQRAKERSLSMRREIYLSAAEAIASAMNTVVRYGDLSLSQNDLTAEYRSKSDQISKIHVVATETTALRFIAFMRDLGATFTKLNIQRMELAAIRAEMQTLIQRMNGHNASRDHYLELMKKFNVEGTMDDRRMAVLESGFQFEQEAATKAAEEHDVLLEKLRPRHLAFVELCQSENIRLSKSLLPLIESVRSELENPINVELYAKVFEGAPVVTRKDLEMLFGVKQSET